MGVLRGLGVRVAACAAVLACALATPAGASTAPVFGVSDGPYDAADIPTAIDRSVQLGARTMRVIVDWATVQPTRGGAYDWSLYDTLLPSLAAHGIRPLLLVENAPDWSHALGDLCFGHTCPPSPGYLGAWQAFVAAAVDRYTHGTYAANPIGVEVWNEPNMTTNWNTLGGPDPSRYVGILDAAATAVRSVAPGLPVVLGGLSTTGMGSHRIAPDVFLRAIYDAGAGNDFDAIGAHDYPSGGTGTTMTESAQGLAGGLDALRSVAAAAGDGAKPLWLTEVGVADPEELPAGQTQASMLGGLYDAAAARGDVPVFVVYRLRQDPSQRGYGLLDTNWGPRPSFGVLAARFGPTPQPGVSASSPTTGQPGAAPPVIGDPYTRPPAYVPPPVGSLPVDPAPAPAQPTSAASSVAHTTAPASGGPTLSALSSALAAPTVAGHDAAPKAKAKKKVKKKPVAKKKAKPKKAKKRPARKPARRR